MNYGMSCAGRICSLAAACLFLYLNLNTAGHTERLAALAKMTVLIST